MSLDPERINVERRAWAARRRVRQPKACIECGRMFTPGLRSPHQIICSAECRYRKERRRQKQRRLEDPEKFRAYDRKCYALHREKRRAKNRAYEAKNKERLTAERKQRYAENKLEMRERARQWRIKHPRDKAASRNCSRKHKDRAAALHRARQAALNFVLSIGILTMEELTS